MASTSPSLQQVRSRITAMQNWTRNRACEGVGVLLLCACTSSALDAERRQVFTPADLSRIEKIDEVVLSPDGQTVAYVKHRAQLSARVFQQTLLGGADYGDIWLVPITGGPALNVTNGEADGSGSWMPRWSPDGTHLAMVSTKGDNNARLWVWSVSARRLTRLSDRGVSLNLPSFGAPMAWIDNQRLVAFLLPPGRQPWQMSLEHEAIMTAMRESQKAWSGSEPTASVLDSGVFPDLASHPQIQLTTLDVRGSEQSLASVPDWIAPAALVAPRVSPDGRHIAFPRLVTVQPPRSDRPIENLSRFGDQVGRYQLSLVDPSGRTITPGMRTVPFVAFSSFRWSPDGHRYAFIGADDAASGDSMRAYLGEVDAGAEVVSLAPDCNAQDVVWAGNGRLLVSAACREADGESRKRRLQWWCVTDGTRTRKVTGRREAEPPELVCDSLGDFCVGVADGQVWRLSIDSGEWTSLTRTPDLRGAGIAWPDRFASRSGVSDVVVRVPHGAMNAYLRVNIASGTVTPLAQPSESARLMAYQPVGGAAIFVTEDRNGTALTLMTPAEHKVLVDTNVFLRQIAEGECRLIDYRSTDGKELKAWLALPPFYEHGKIYPLVTVVYAGAVMSETPRCKGVNSDATFWLNEQLLLARDYAVLYPSMPLKPLPDGHDNPASDPMLDLTKGVLPAIDKVISLGVADPERVAVIGHSYGGYATYGLVTQTNRFKAAIVASGYADEAALYGTFVPPLRYRSNPHEISWFEATAETGQHRMGVPPWKDLGRYLRNSPSFYVDRVETPVLILHGDADVFPIQQAEVFFKALYRQGKRARFVRYWGEGHVLSSPANIRDVWSQIYAWLDEFCDVSRDPDGNMVFEGAGAKSRNGASALKPDYFSRLH
jgi:dipeptidyl aminopeptidase/acylaminoacyl peptidase